MRSHKSVVSFVIVVAAACFLPLAPAWANVKESKAYKGAFPGEKPKCLCCHTSEKPKKEDGQHDLNDYGKKVIAIKAEPDAETFKQAGSNNCATAE